MFETYNKHIHREKLAHTVSCFEMYTIKEK